MELETIHDAPLGAPLRDVAQEAIDTVATTYTRTPGTDVLEDLRAQLRSRGLRATSDADLEELAAAIRSGHTVRLGEHDGSVEP